MENKAYVVLINKGYVAAPKRVVCMATCNAEAIAKVQAYYKNETEPVKIRSAHPLNAYEIIEGLPHEHQM